MKRKLLFVMLDLCFIMAVGLCFSPRCFLPSLSAEWNQDKAPDYSSLSFPEVKVLDKGQIDDNEDLATCHIEKSGIKFLCDLDWQMMSVNDNTTMMIISSDPYVTLTIARLNSEITFLGQLSRSFFEERNLFADNFQKSIVPFAQIQAVEIKGFSKRRPDLRFLGYFYIHDSKLNSVLFSVYPREKWDDYKFLIKRIVDSFQMD